MLAKTYLNRTITGDALKDAQDAIRTELHVREARKLGLAVVECPKRHPDEIAEETTADAMHRGSFTTVAVSGAIDVMCKWLWQMDEMSVAWGDYEFELPPAAREEYEEEDLWAENLTDRVDVPSVRVGATICSDDEQWQWGLPAPTPPAPRTVSVQVGNLMDVEVTLLNLKADAVAYRRVQEALEAAGFAHDTIDGAIETMQAIGRQLRGEVEAVQLVAQA